MDSAGGSGDLEHIFFEATRALGSDTGTVFFRSLVRQLATVLEAEFVLVGAIEPGGARVRTLSAMASGRELPNFEYDLAGTPCAGVLTGQLCSYSENVHSRFPEDAQLVEMRAEGYVGAPLVDANGKCLGLICAITKRPIENVKLAEALLRIFAVRATAELERERYEGELARNEQRLRSFVTHGNEAMIRVDLDPPLPPSLSEDEQIEHYYRHGHVGDANDQAATIFGFAGAEGLIGSPLEFVAPRNDPDQIERLREGIRVGWKFSQVERPFANRTFLMTREGTFEGGRLSGAWVTMRDISALKEAQARVQHLNRELERRVEE